MIKYQLICQSEHEFEAWFRDSADFDRQSAGGLIECPACGGRDVRKGVMSPAVARSGALSGSSKNHNAARFEQVKSDMAEAANRARAYVEKNFDHVGERFPEEARRIHYGETKKRDIYGEASGAEVKELVEEGVPVAPVPGVAPTSKAKKKIN